MTDTPPERREAEAPRDSDVATSGAEASREQLAAENARLRARVAELEAAAGRRSDGDERGMAHPGGSVSYQHLLTLIDNAPNSIFVKDVNHRLIFVNKKFASDWQRSPAELLGLSEVDLFPAAQAAEFLALEAQILASGEPVGREDRIVTPEGERWVHSNKFPIHDAEGSCLGISAFITDITDRRRAAAERLELKEQVIAAQQAALRELSTPLLPLTEGVLAMPLIGTIDSARAAEILETLLQGISARHVHTAILDITGVREVDAQTANALVGAARAARLLGARVILTGISPAVARMLVTLDANLGDIAILATLASGIAHALSR